MTKEEHQQIKSKNQTVLGNCIYKKKWEESLMYSSFMSFITYIASGSAIGRN